MRLEANALLATTTAAALALLICSAYVFGMPGQIIKYLIVAAVVPAAFIPLNDLMRKKMGWATLPMIHPLAPTTAMWAAAFPAMISLGAVIPFFFPMKDYGLLVLIGSIWFGVTLDSAFRARKA